MATSPGNTSALDLSRTYSSFSGCDIKAVVNGQPLGTLQGISYAIQREKAPTYVMGRVDPLSFSRGKRGIAGTIITLMMDEHMLYKESAFNTAQVILDKDELFADPALLNTINYNSAGNAVEDINQPLPSFNTNDLSDNFVASNAVYVDQLPPFDVVIVAANEYGNAATMRIYGIEILNEGSGFSIDDIVIENQMTYVCRTILPWQKMGSWKPLAGGTYGGFEPDPVGPSRA